jgi:hypothetical protein
MIALQSLKTTAEGQICTFLLPRSYTLPIHLAQATQDEWVLAFHIVDKVLASKDKYCSEEFSNSIAKDFSKQHERDLQKSMETHKKELERLESELTTEIKGLEKTLSNKEHSYQKQITELQVALDRASMTYESMQKQFLEEAERRVNQQKESDHQLINHLKSDLSRQREENESLKEKLDSKNSINQNSSKKGKLGEENFEAILKEKKRDWKLIYQGNQGHAADYSMNLYGIHIRFEVKNYTDVVKTKEVEKLRNDLREHPETDVGVFVSLNTGITGFTGIGLEWTPTNQLILYIPVFLQQDIDIILDFVDILFQTVKPYRCILASNEEKDEQPIYRERIDRAIVYAQNGITRITAAMSQFVKDTKALQDKIDDMTSHTKTNLAAQKEEIQSMLAILTGQNVEVEDVPEPESLPVVHEEKKRGGRKKKETPV